MPYNEQKVANPIKIQYRDAFRFAPFSIMVDPERVRSLILNETQTGFPEDVAYLFGKQMEEADTIVRESLDKVSRKMAINSGIDDLQCFSPAYPEPAHVIREPVD